MRDVWLGTGAISEILTPMPGKATTFTLSNFARSVDGRFLTRSTCHQNRKSLQPDLRKNSLASLGSILVDTTDRNSAAWRLLPIRSAGASSCNTGIPLGDNTVQS